VIQSEAGEDVQKIESGVGRHIPYRGASHSKAPYSAQYQQGDDQLDNKFNEHLNKFYDRVISHLRAAQSVLIFGPGEAKRELEKRIIHDKLKVQIVGVEPADKMTERQVASRVRDYFQ
jgi:hypothetical protein